MKYGVVIASGVLVLACVAGWNGFQSCRQELVAQTVPPADPGPPPSPTPVALPPELEKELRNELRSTHPLTGSPAAPKTDPTVVPGMEMFLPPLADKPAAPARPAVEQLKQGKEEVDISPKKTLPPASLQQDVIDLSAGGSSNQ